MMCCLLEIYEAGESDDDDGKVAFPQAFGGIAGTIPFLFFCYGRRIAFMALGVR